MASSTYDQRWQEAMAELDEQVHIEDHTLGDDSQDGGGNEPVSGRRDWRRCDHDS